MIQIGVNKLMSLEEVLRNIKKSFGSFPAADLNREIMPGVTLASILAAGLEVDVEYIQGALSGRFEVTV